MRYKIINNYDLEKFNEKVEEMLNQGWELYGYPFCGSSSTEEGFVVVYFNQALTKTDN